MRNDANANEDERPEATPVGLPATAQLPENNIEVEVNDETQTIRNVVQVMEEGFIAYQTPKNEQMEINDDNDGQPSELEPDNPSSNKSVLVLEAWKQYRQQSTNL